MLSQFNAVYVETVHRIRQVEAQTGLKARRVKLQNLSKVVHSLPHASSIAGSNNAINPGWYMQDTKVGAAIVRFGF